MMKLPPSKSKYRGVVRQHNGKWGVLAYKDGHRIWLGSFWTEVAAAEAYDIAAQCLHGCYAKTNFKPLSKSDSASEAELRFLHSHTATEIVNMIRSRTYHAEFVRCMHDILIQQQRSPNGCKVLMQDAEPTTRELLFHKVLSRSDVGQQNRLVIPKQQAVKHFFSGDSSRGGDVIDLEDEAGKIWSFRYTLWRGNRVHVLSRGWNNFVVAKGLRHGDMIRFWRHTDELGTEHLSIECNSTNKSAAVAQVVHQSHHNMNRIIRLFGANINIDLYNNNNNNN